MFLFQITPLSVCFVHNCERPFLITLINWTFFSEFLERRKCKEAIFGNLYCTFSEDPCIKVQNLQYKFLDWKWPPPLEIFPKIHPIWYRHPFLSSLYLSALLEWVFDPYLTILFKKWELYWTPFVHSCILCVLSKWVYTQKAIFLVFLRYLCLCWNNVRFRV